MAIDKREIEHTANLARIRLSEEKDNLTADLVKILEYVGQLQRVDTSGAGDLDYADKPVNQLREDSAGTTEIQEAILSQAPKSRGRYFEVKGVFE